MTTPNDTSQPVPNAAPPIVEMTFEKRAMPRPEIPTYRVYRDAKDFVTVNASNAHEAFTRAGIATPFRIQREDPSSRVLLDHKMFEELTGGGAKEAPTAAEPAAETAAPAPAAETPAQPTA